MGKVVLCVSFRLAKVNRRQGTLKDLVTKMYFRFRYICINGPVTFEA